MRTTHRLLAYKAHQIARSLPWQQSKIFVRQSSYFFLGGSLLSSMVISEMDFEKDALSKDCTTFFIHFLFVKF